MREPGRLLEKKLLIAVEAGQLDSRTMPDRMHEGLLCDPYAYILTKDASHGPPFHPPRRNAFGCILKVPSGQLGSMLRRYI
jgi:hypothetical protein